MITPPYIKKNILITALFIMFTMLICATTANAASTSSLNPCLENAPTALAKLECFRGLPYRVDGALDTDGRWTTWANQTKEFSSAGFNCSGFTTAFRNSIETPPLPLNAAQYDRQQDSGPTSSMGQDWDFGIDLILNLTEAQPRRLMPNPYEAQNISAQSWSAHQLRGTNIDSKELPALLAQLQENKIYYFAISKSDSRFKGGISFYHVGVLIKDRNAIWMYHATAKGGVYRVNLAGESGLAWLRRYYGASSLGSRYIQLVEVPISINH